MIDEELLEALRRQDEIRQLGPTIQKGLAEGFSLREIHRTATDLGRVNCRYEAFRRAVTRYLLKGVGIREYRKTLLNIEQRRGGEGVEATAASSERSGKASPKRLGVHFNTFEHDPKAKPEEVY